jgi:hypothetical protein
LPLSQPTLYWDYTHQKMNLETFLIDHKIPISN